MRGSSIPGSTRLYLQGFCPQCTGVLQVVVPQTGTASRLHELSFNFVSFEMEIGYLALERFRKGYADCRHLRSPDSCSCFAIL